MGEAFFQPLFQVDPLEERMENQEAGLLLVFNVFYATVRFISTLSISAFKIQYFIKD